MSYPVMSHPASRESPPSWALALAGHGGIYGDAARRSIDLPAVPAAAAGGVSQAAGEATSCVAVRVRGACARNRCGHRGMRRRRW